MAVKNILSGYQPLRYCGKPRSAGESPNVINNTSFSIERILDTTGEIDFSVLVNFLKSNTTEVNDFFRNKDHIERILFPFLDFLKNKHFSENKVIPEDILTILRDNMLLRDAVIAYIEKKNLQIISSQHIEQYDTIDFHLFLLGMRQDFDLIKDIQQDCFDRIDGLFTSLINSICRSLGVMDVWKTRRNLPDTLIRELNSVIQLAETINKLALIHAVNLEKRQISFELGKIIRNHIDPFIEQLDTDFVEEHIIGKKLRYLSGKVQSNFAHGVVINGVTIHQIEQQVLSVKEQQRLGFERQKASDFGGDMREEESSRMILMGNETIIDLVGIERIEKLSGSIPRELHIRKGELLNNLTSIYGYGAGLNFATREDIIDDFIQGGIKNEYQIEVIYYTILFDATIKDESLAKLMYFFMDKSKQVKNFFYEEFVIKIIAQIIRRLHTSPERLSFAPLMEMVRHSLGKNDVSHSFLNHSQVYLSLALYYIACRDREYMEAAQICFFHYKNLDTVNKSADKDYSNSRDEKDFYRILGSVDELECFGQQLHNHEGLRKNGIRTFEHYVADHQKLSILSIESEVNEITSAMNTTDEVYSQDRIDKLLGKKIAETFFYNLCSITIIGDCQNCNMDKGNNECRCSQESLSIRTEKCPLVPLRRGFQKRHIPLPQGVFIVFIYPVVAEVIFEKIFSEKQSLIKQRFGNLIITNNKNAARKRYQDNIERLAFYDTETGLPNKNRLNNDINGREKAVIFIEVAGYHNIVATHGGEKDWIEIIKKVAMYLVGGAPGIVYRYNETTLCLVCDSDMFSNMSSIMRESIEDTAHTFVDALLCNFFVDHGKNLQFHAGITVGLKEDHAIYAGIALTKAKQSREKNIYVFKEGDDQTEEDIRDNTDILIAALNSQNISTRFLPYYQRIHDPRTPLLQKFEALARIERSQSGTEEKEIVVPFRFINIATQKSWLSDLTLSMFPQILTDMRIYPDMHVSINLHEQDWNDERIMVMLRSIHHEGEVDVSRISIEILETVPFDRLEDKKKIQEIKALGYKISIDDYGEKEGNLKKIMFIRPDNIKIDQAIIVNLSNPEHKNDAIAVIKAVVYHAGLIGATITAEYVETQETFDLLRNLGVDCFQGYYFAKPLPIEEIMKKD